jgi:alcohol dehydrogenase class IV
MKWAAENDSDETASLKLVENLFILNEDLKVPSLKDLGHSVDHDLLKVMATQALASGSPQNNPRVPTENQIIQLYQDIWE